MKGECLFMTPFLSRNKDHFGLECFEYKEES